MEGYTHGRGGTCVYSKHQVTSDYINLGFTRHGTAEYTEPPPRCFKCQRFGHVAKFCKGELRCKLCGGPHDFKTCKADYKCPNCNSDHPASYSGCPYRVSALHRRKSFLTGPKPNKQTTARSTAQSPEDFPPLVKERISTSPKNVRELQLEECFLKTPGNASQAKQGAMATESTQNISTQATYARVLRQEVEQKTKGHEENIHDTAEIVRVLFAALLSNLVTMPLGTAKTMLQAVLALESVLLGCFGHNQQ